MFEERPVRGDTGVLPGGRSSILRAMRDRSARALPVESLILGRNGTRRVRGEPASLAARRPKCDPLSRPAVSRRPGENRNAFLRRHRLGESEPTRSPPSPIIRATPPPGRLPSTRAPSVAAAITPTPFGSSPGRGPASCGGAGRTTPRTTSLGIGRRNSSSPRDDARGVDTGCLIRRAPRGRRR